MKTLTVILLVLGLAVSLSRAQGMGKPERTQEGAIRLTAELVELDVVATDSHGRPVGDLEKEEFEVYEDGVRQEIVTFERLIEAFEPMNETTSISSSGKSQEVSDTPARISRPRAVHYSVINLDLIRDEDRALLAARKEKLFKSFDELIFPSDRVAVALGGVLIQDFTSDLDLVKEAFWKIVSTPNFFQAHRELPTDREFLQVSPDSREVSLGGLVTRQRVIRDVEAEHEEYLGIISLRKLQRFVRALGTLPGRKNFIWLNGGLGYSDELEKLISAANQAEVSFYIISVRGLVAVPLVPLEQLGIDDPRKRNVGEDVFRRYSAISGSSFGSRVLANNTGGRFYGLNWPELGLKQVALDAHNYYRLAYYPTNLNADGKFRKITVKVQRDGVQVRTRAGYLAPKPFRQMAAEERRDHLVQALLSDKSYRQLPVIAQAYVFPQPSGEAVIPLGIEVESAALPLQPEQGRYRAQVDVVIQFLTESGQLAGSVNRTIDLNFTEQSYRQLLAGVFRYSTEVKLKPDQYRLRVVVRENEQGRVGSVEEPLGVPALGEDLVVSDLMVSAPGRPGMPTVSRQFERAWRVMLHLQIFNRSTSGRVGTTLTVFYEIAKNGQVVWRKQEDFTDPALTRPIKLNRWLPLENLSSGQYTLRVIVVDPMSNRRETRQTDFTVKR